MANTEIISNTDKNSNRGGYRPGAGRKSKYESGPLVTVSFCSTREQKNKIDSLSQKLKLTRGELIEKAVSFFEKSIKQPDENVKKEGENVR